LSFGQTFTYYHDALDRLRPLGKEAPPFLIFQIKANLAYVESLLQKDPQECRRMLTEALDLAQHEPSIPRLNVAAAQSTLGGILLNEGKYAEAEPVLRKSVEMFTQANARSAEAASPIYLLVVLYGRQNNFAAARDYARQYYDLAKSLLGPDSVMAAEGELLWARYRADTGEPAPAMQQVLEALPVIRRTFPPLSVNLWTPLAAAAHVFNAAGLF